MAITPTRETVTTKDIERIFGVKPRQASNKRIAVIRQLKAMGKKTKYLFVDDFAEVTGLSRDRIKALQVD